MLYERRIGSVRVQNIVELIGPTHDPARAFPDMAPQELARHAPPLAPEHYAPSINRFIVGIQIWIAHIGKDVIVIDTGVGNAKPRGLPRFNMLNTLVPLWLQAAGADRHQVTHVINTHLHGDHVGWNTISANGKAEPYFPNAQYWMPTTDFDYFQKIFEETKGVGETEALADCVFPLIDDGRVKFYAEGAEVAPGLVAKLARGHTPGQHVFHVQSGGEKGVFCADIFHSPIQVALPHVNSAFCVEGEHARETRKRFLADVAASGALIMPCHFGFPHCGTVAIDGGAYRFVPERRGGA